MYTVHNRGKTLIASSSTIVGVMKSQAMARSDIPPSLDMDAALADAMGIGGVSAMLMLGGLGLAAGAAGLPFAQDAGKAVETTYHLITNADPNFEEHFLQFMKEARTLLVRVC